MSRMTNDVENISNTVSQSIALLFQGVLTLVGCLVFMLYYSPMLTLVSLTSVVLTLVVTKNLPKFMRKYFRYSRRFRQTERTYRKKWYPVTER